MLLVGVNWAFNTCYSLQVDFNFVLGITEKSVNKTMVQKTLEGSRKATLST